MEPGQAFAVGSLALNLALLLFTSLHLSARSCKSPSGPGNTKAPESTDFSEALA